MAIKTVPIEADQPDPAPATRKTKSKPSQAVFVAPDAPPKKLRGFAAMSPEKLKTVSQRGGRALKNSYTFQNIDLAVAAGRAGGKASKRRKVVKA